MAVGIAVTGRAVTVDAAEGAIETWDVEFAATVGWQADNKNASTSNKIPNRVLPMNADFFMEVGMGGVNYQARLPLSFNMQINSCSSFREVSSRVDNSFVVAETKSVSGL